MRCSAPMPVPERAAVLRMASSPFKSAAHRMPVAFHDSNALQIAFLNDPFVRFAIVLDAVLPLAALIREHPNDFEVAGR
jgi:hypothetical protein